MEIMNYALIAIGVYALVVIGILGIGVPERNSGFIRKMMTRTQTRIMYIIMGIAIIVMVILQMN